MIHDRDDAGDDALAGIDLHRWHVPPPAALDRPALLARALAPAAPAAKRPRTAWVLAAVVVLNAAIATLIVILLARPSATQTTVAVQPAGGGTVDVQVRALLQRLDQEQRELERKLAEIEELRTLVVELSEKVRLLEQQDGRRDRTVPKPRERQAPARSERAPIDPSAPFDGACDEVACVLTDYQKPCCTKFRAPRAPATTATPPASTLPDGLDRHSISKGMAAVKQRVAGCADHATPKGQVKLRVQVGADGLVTSVLIMATPEAALGACVEDAVRRAVFARTQHGGVFSYPFVF